MTTSAPSTSATSAALPGTHALDAAAEIGVAGGCSAAPLGTRSSSGKAAPSPSVCDVCQVDPVTVIDGCVELCSGCAYEQLVGSTGA